jgi:hypothetical protein
VSREGGDDATCGSAICIARQKMQHDGHSLTPSLPSCTYRRTGSSDVALPACASSQKKVLRGSSRSAVLYMYTLHLLSNVTLYLHCPLHYTIHYIALHMYVHCNAAICYGLIKIHSYIRSWVSLFDEGLTCNNPTTYAPWCTLSSYATLRTHEGECSWCQQDMFRLLSYPRICINNHGYYNLVEVYIIVNSSLSVITCEL